MVNSSSASLPEPEKGSGLLAALMAAVRPEFRRDMIVPARGEMDFTATGCQVPECQRPTTARGCADCTTGAGRQEGSRRWRSSAPIPVVRCC